MKKRIAITALLVLCVVSVAIAALAFVPASRVYCVESTFTTAPNDDALLVTWLKNQPGVVEHTVHVDRTNSQPPKLVLTFIIVQNSWLRPPFPDVEARAAELGYSFDSNGFRDQRE